MQANWMRWQESVFPYDLSWDNLILGAGDRIIAFVLNATHNSVMTPDLRKICALTISDSCHLCNGRATLNHILSSCTTALHEGRFTWRHDSVLATVLQSTQPALIKHNNNPPKTPKWPSINKSFVPAGSGKPSSLTKSSINPSLLGSASDWKLLVDFTHNQYVFPAHIFPTNQRPDLLLYSNNLRRVIFGELTCPAEENIEPQHIHKASKYQDLADEIRNAHRDPWDVVILPFEVGSRGFVAKSLQMFLRKIGLSKTANRQCCRNASEVASRCSYAIYQYHDKPNWLTKPLLFPNSCVSPSLEIDPCLRHQSVAFSLPVPPPPNP